MANLNKVLLIGRLTRDPEPITLGGATAGAKFGFAVNNRKQVNGEWKDVPVWIDCEIWNRGESKQADRVISTLRKGQSVYLEGHLKLDEWDDKNGGGKRTALRVVVDLFQYLEAKQDGAAAPFASRPMTRPSAPVAPVGSRPSFNISRDNVPTGDYNDEPPYPSSSTGREDDIPF